MLVSSIWIISRLDSRSKFQMFTLFSGRYLGVPRLLHIGLCEFVQNNSTNISSVWKRTDLKLGEVSFLLTSYTVTISWIYPLNGFGIILLLRQDCLTLQTKNCFAGVNKHQFLFYICAQLKCTLNSLHMYDSFKNT